MEAAESIFEEWESYALKRKLKSRDADLKKIENNSKLKIIAITGVRRCGKSSLLMLLDQMLNKEGRKAAYINLEDSRIKDRRNILDEIIKWFGDSGCLLLDEITSVYEWEGWLARNHEMLKEKLHLVVSSSRRSLVFPKKPLRGRILQYELYPLSFSEFLKFSNIVFERTTAGIGKIEKFVIDYLIYGGFPEVVLVEDKTDKVRILNSYFKDIIALDIADVAKENLSVVELFAKYIIEATYFSASKCLNFLKSLGYKIGKQSILNLEKYAQEGYLFFFVPIFSYKIKDRAQYSRKAYVGDSGLIYALSGKKDMGRLFENCVFLELRRRIGLNQDINYWKNANGREADFVIREGTKVKELIQVVYDMNDEKTKEREIMGLIECAKEFGLKSGKIITRSVEGSEKVEGIRIEMVPLWKWLLNDR